MRRKITGFTALIAMICISLSGLHAQDVLMNSAETINPGNLKISLFPTVLFGKNGGAAEWGTAARVGFGLAPRFDIEAKAAWFEGLRYYGLDVEFWLIRNSAINASASFGVHMTDFRYGNDTNGFDFALIISSKPRSRLEFYGGFKAAFDTVKNTNLKYTYIHVVPGLEYRVSRTIDFLAEVGIAVNQNSTHYASIGLAFYLFR